VARIRQLTARSNQLEADLDRRVAPPAGHLRQVVGLGPWGGQAHRGDRWVGRFGRSTQFAMHAGVAPIPVWSANRTRHRLNRG
jgi:transposase